MDPEFEFEEIKETEAERLQRLVRTTDSISLLQFVRRRAMRLAVQTSEAEYLRIARRGVARQNYWQMLG
jgi:hypothetical protein